MKNKLFRSGFISIIGRPNVGKSTLLNEILKEKLAIISNKPQTTRNRILGIRNTEQSQMVFIDTPGIHKPKNRLNEIMVKTAVDTLKEVDVVAFLVEAGDSAGGRDRYIIDTFLNNVRVPVVLVINKIDLVRKENLLPLIGEYNHIRKFAEIIPVSALKGDNVEHLLDVIEGYLPEGPKYYPDDIYTDQPERFIAAEIVREKIINRTKEEIPYSVAVAIEEFKERENGNIYISALIYVERDSQKGIIIGRAGRMLKDIGTEAREGIEKLLGTKVFLELRVKLKKDWRSDNRVLKELGYE